MLTTNSLIKTSNLINASRITVISSGDSDISYKLVLSLCAADCIESVQYHTPETLKEITSTFPELLNQFKIQHQTKINWYILNLSGVSNLFDYDNLTKAIWELDELSKTFDLKIIVLFPNKNILLWEKLCLSFENKQDQDFLFLTMNTQQPITLTVETGNNKGNNIFYEFDNDIDTLIKEIE